jgi:hypothetical protein
MGAADTLQARQKKTCLICRGSLTALEQWVENGVAPNQILATQYNNNDATQGVQRTRPLCPYTQISSYEGTGDPNNGANFVCVNDEDDYNRDVANALQSITANAAFAAAGRHTAH